MDPVGCHALSCPGPVPPDCVAAPLAAQRNPTKPGSGYFVYVYAVRMHAGPDPIPAAGFFFSVRVYV